MWVNILRLVFSDNVGIVRYIFFFIDGKFLLRISGYYMIFIVVDVSGNLVDCKIILYVGGKNIGCKI